MSKTIGYRGNANVRTVRDSDFLAYGITHATTTWNQANAYQAVVSDAAAVFLLAQSTDFFDVGGLTLPAAMDSSFWGRRQMGSSSLGDWRTHNVGLSRRSIQEHDILITGDSISEGWTSLGGPAPQTQTWPRGERDQHGWVGRFRRLLQVALNPDQRGGIWVPAGGGWWGPSPWVFSSNGADTEVNNGISLRARQMSVSNANPATLTAPMCDAISVFYNKMNVFGGCELRISVDGVQQTQVATYDGTLPAFGTEAYKYTWTGTRGPHTLSLAAVANGGFNTLCQVIGAYFHDGDNGQNVRVLNGSHFGYALATYNAAGATAYGSMISKGLIKPRLVIIAMGTNDNPATYEQDLRDYITMMNSLTAANGQLKPAYAVLTPPAAGSNPNSIREPMRSAAYEVMADVNGDVWEWNEFQGSVAVADGNDPHGITYDIFNVKDNTHPGGAGMRALGEYVASRFFTNTSSVVGIENLAMTLNSGRKIVNDLGTVGATATLNADQFEAHRLTLGASNLTLTLSSALAGTRAHMSVQITQNASVARTVTMSPLVKWTGGTAYTASTGLGAIDKLELDTFDGGATWVGSFTKGHA